MSVRAFLPGGPQRVFLALYTLLAAPLSVTAAAPEPTAQHPIVIRAGRLLDVESGRMLSNQLIVVREGRIQLVGAADGPAAEVPADATSLDLSNQTVLPGLVDCHTHL